jgi:hypothetical protein
MKKTRKLSDLAFPTAPKAISNTDLERVRGGDGTTVTIVPCVRVIVPCVRIIVPCFRLP